MRRIKVRDISQLFRQVKVTGIFISFFISLLTCMGILIAVTAFVNQQCLEWLSGVIQLVFFLVAVIVMNRKKVRKHTVKYIFALLISLVAGKYLPAIIHSPDASEMDKIKVRYDKGAGKIEIDMNALSESALNSLSQVSLVAEDNQTHWVCIFRILQLQGSTIVMHQFTPDEKEFLSSKDYLQLRFSKRFSLEPAFIFQQDCR
jgi:hypothetical protein